MKNFEIKMGFNYFEFSVAFEKHLIENQILKDNRLESWIEMYETLSYCQLNYEHFIAEVDNTFATSPTIGGTFIDCSDKEDFFTTLDNDSLEFHGTAYTLSLLKKIQEKDFEMIPNKIFFVYQTNILYPLCNQIFVLWVIKEKQQSLF